jgi:AGCS family alanine or glycine:cation symporter
MSFLIGADKKHYYNYFYIVSIILGATTSLNAMINLIDGVFALMAIPTMLSTIILAPKVVKELSAYTKRLKEGKT